MKEKISELLNKIRHTERKTIISSAIAIALVIGAGVWLTLYNESMTVAVWITTFGTIFGAFFGALLAGIISLRSVEKQIEYDKNEKQKKENQYLGNVSAQLCYSFEEVVGQLASIKENHDEHQSGISYSKLKFRFNRLNDLSKTIEKVDISGLPFDENYWTQQSKLNLVYRISDIEDVLRQLELSHRSAGVYVLPNGERSFLDHNDRFIGQIRMSMKSINEAKKMLDNIKSRYLNN